MQQNKLQQYFPLIRQREDILNEIQQTPHLLQILPNDSTRLTDETTLLATDIVVG